MTMRDFYELADEQRRRGEEVRASEALIETLRRTPNVFRPNVIDVRDFEVERVKREQQLAHKCDL